MATLTGRTLGKYQIFERIGRGGMADVYKGRHTRLDRDVAIKVLHSHLAEGEDFQARFEREARAIASLQHPYIVQIYDFDVEDDLVYMVMEFIRGGNLKLRLEQAFQEKRFLGMEFIQQILEQVGDGLDYAHKQGMLHRDVKPANVLLHEDGKAVLADFGIARIVSNTQFTATGSLIGTPAYMSPEQGRGETLTPASDLYALGIILYELLTNHVPFDAETPLAIIHKQIHDPLPNVTKFRDDLPCSVIDVVEKGLAKEPERRFESARDLYHAFQVGTEMQEQAEQTVQEELETIVLMEESLDSGELKATVVMEEEETLGETVVMEEVGDGVVVEVQPEAVPPIPDPDHVDESPPAGEAERTGQKSFGRFLPGILVGLVVIALIVVGSLLGWFSSEAPSCDEIGQCIQFSENAMRAGDFADAIYLLEQAIERVPPDEQPSFAELWCRRADSLLAFDRFDEAIGSFEMCVEWTHGNPEFQGLREEAGRRIEELVNP